MASEDETIKMEGAAYDGHASKRQRTDNDSFGARSNRREDFADRLAPSPSPVVHVRGLTEMVVESHLIEAVQQFGAVSYCIMMPKRRQALIEFEEVDAATGLVNYTQGGNTIYVAGKPAQFNYSTSQKIQRPSGDDRGGSNKILLFTILNPKYPINVDVMNTICSQSGEVQRIVIFKKNGIQAMVEFDTVESAMRSKQSLNGADIYSGCCTLKIEFAKPTRLNVYRNDQDSWDYTNPNLGMGKDTSPAGKGAPLLAEPRYGSGPQPYDRRGPPPPGRMPQQGPPAYGGMDYGQGEQYPQSDNYGRAPERYSQPMPQVKYPGSHNGRESADPYGRPQESYQPPPQERYSDPYGPPARHDQYGGASHNFTDPSQSSGMCQQGAVMMVYGLNPEKMNCQKMFNMFCLYGNVVRVKFLRSKEGVAMIQMGDPAACERAQRNLHNTFFFDMKMQLGLSKQAFLQDVHNPHELKDGEKSFEDFMGNRNNRFTNPEAAAKNRIHPPSKSLYFFNAPPNVTEDDLRAIFTNVGCKSPIAVKKFPTRSEGKSSTGLLEWESKGDSMEALISGNHSHLPNPTGKHPYVIKLCFSNSERVNF